MIDLHIHTCYSDGTDDVLTLLEKAEKLGLEAISITDHDTVDAYEELYKIDVHKYYNGIIITGTEIKTTFNKIPIEILGYNIDTRKFNASPCADFNRRITTQNKYLQNFINVGNSLGIKCDSNIIIKDDKSYAADTYFREIKRFNENYKNFPELLNMTESQFYRHTSGNLESPFYIDESKDALDINFVINEIHKCGGLAFLPHLFESKVEDHLAFLEEIINTTKIDGIECYYSTFTEEQANSIIEITKKYNKYISGGSDYHGTHKNSISIGSGYGNLNIPLAIIQNWQKQTSDKEYSNE